MPKVAELGTAAEPAKRSAGPSTCPVGAGTAGRPAMSSSTRSGRTATTAGPEAAADEPVLVNWGTRDERPGPASGLALEDFLRWRGAPAASGAGGRRCRSRVPPDRRRRPQRPRRLRPWRRPAGGVDPPVRGGDPEEPEVDPEAAREPQGAAAPGPPQALPVERAVPASMPDHGSGGRAERSTACGDLAMVAAARCPARRHRRSPPADLWGCWVPFLSACRVEGSDLGGPACARALRSSSGRCRRSSGRRRPCHAATRRGPDRPRQHHRRHPLRRWCRRRRFPVVPANQQGRIERLDRAGGGGRRQGGRSGGHPELGGGRGPRPARGLPKRGDDRFQNRTAPGCGAAGWTSMPTTASPAEPDRERELGRARPTGRYQVEVHNYKGRSAGDRPVPFSLRVRKATRTG